jgi:hypothetical protein
MALDVQGMASPDHKKRKKAAVAKIRLVEEILRRWDPIGVEPGTIAPADEYDSYAAHIVSMVEGGCAVEELASHLGNLASVTMGVGSNLKSNATFAAQMIDVLRPSNSSLERTRER